VTRAGLKLTTYFGERDRADGTFLADALLDLYERHGVEVSVLLRGTEGFGLKHRLHSQRLLTLSEDLPVMTVAVDTAERIRALLPDVVARTGDGLVTLERARMLTGRIDATGERDEEHDATKLTLYVGRRERAGGRLAYLAVVDLLHRRGIAGATVLLGVDGTVAGERRRARFLAGNADVPLMIVSVGDGARIAAVAPELEALLERPVSTLERVQVCKRDGRLLSVPRRWPTRPGWASGRISPSSRASSRATTGGRCTSSSCTACARPAPPARRSCVACGATTATTPRTASASGRWPATSRS
jgi:PII-like signaling protein